MGVQPDSAATVLITGGAGFIGSHVCERLVARGDRVIAIDNFDPFYDPALKRGNLASLERHERFRLIEGDVLDTKPLESQLAGERIDAILHLAARPGVRPSIERPELYVATNVQGTASMLELARRLEVGRFVFGSSSSVYGDTAAAPFRETDAADRPLSPYAASKRAGELLCHTYHHLYSMSVVCLRFFTVYGPRQRPDLAIHKFARLMTRGEEIPFYGDGSSERDYTYVGDIVQGVEAAMSYTERPQVFEVVNLGESRTTSLAALVRTLSRELGVTPGLNRLPAQPGDVTRTFASVDKAGDLLGYSPAAPVEEGIRRFVRWFTAQWESEDGPR